MWFCQDSHAISRRPWSMQPGKRHAETAAAEGEEHEQAKAQYVHGAPQVEGSG
jgi:hypothetical protein